MSEIVIRIRENGPLVVEGEFKLHDTQGEQFELPANKPVVALCRCGASKKRPFCDGAHKQVDFVCNVSAKQE